AATRLLPTVDAAGGGRADVLLCPNAPAERPAHRRGAPDDEADRPHTPGAGSDNHAPAAARERLPRPDDHHPVRRLCAAGDAAGGGGALWRPRLLGLAAD